MSSKVIVGQGRFGIRLLCDVETIFFTDEVKFGEVVKAPPRLSARPRGSDKKTRKVPQLELLKKLSTTPLAPGPPGPPDPPVHVGLKHKRDIEEERTRAISEYRMAKKAKMAKLEGIIK